MGKLADIMLAPESRGKAVDDCVRIIEARVAATKGASGMVIRAGYKAFKSMKPGITREVMDHLLPDFVEVLEKRLEEWEAAGSKQSYADWLASRSEEVAEDLLGVTDRLVRKSNKGAVKKTYNGVRKFAKKQVAEAIPEMGRMVEDTLRDSQ